MGWSRSSGGPHDHVERARSRDVIRNPIHHARDGGDQSAASDSPRARQDRQTRGISRSDILRQSLEDFLFVLEFKLTKWQPTPDDAELLARRSFCRGDRFVHAQWRQPHRAHRVVSRSRTTSTAAWIARDGEEWIHTGTFPMKSFPIATHTSTSGIAG